MNVSDSSNIPNIIINNTHWPKYVRGFVSALLSNNLPHTGFTIRQSDEIITHTARLGASEQIIISTILL